MKPTKQIKTFLFSTKKFQEFLHLYISIYNLILLIVGQNKFLNYIESKLEIFQENRDSPFFYIFILCTIYK